MTQPAKVQEPSMEEILASIRRIIADDEAKPPVAEKAPSPPPPPPAAVRPEKPAAVAPAPKQVMNNIPPSNIPAAKTAAPKPAAAPPPKPAPAPVVPNSQDDIDALLSGLDEAPTAAEIRPSQPEQEVLELTDEMALPSAPPPRSSFKKVEPQDDLEFSEAAAKPAAYRPPAYEPPPFESPPVSQQILSRSTASAVESAFSSLASTMPSSNGRTLEDLVKEMLRPMLKSWLDDNLPGLVERIVKAEIERVSRGR
jgi:uncharacterized protein